MKKRWRIVLHNDMFNHGLTIAQSEAIKAAVAGFEDSLEVILGKAPFRVTVELGNNPMELVLGDREDGEDGRWSVSMSTAEVADALGTSEDGPDA